MKCSNEAHNTDSCPSLLQASERREGGRTQRDQRGWECEPRHRNYLPVWSQWTKQRRWEQTGMSYINSFVWLTFSCRWAGFQSKERDVCCQVLRIFQDVVRSVAANHDYLWFHNEITATTTVKWETANKAKLTKRTLAQQRSMCSYNQDKDYFHLDTCHTANCDLKKQRDDVQELRHVSVG